MLLYMLSYPKVSVHYTYKLYRSAKIVKMLRHSYAVAVHFSANWLQVVYTLCRDPKRLCSQFASITIIIIHMIIISKGLQSDRYKCTHNIHRYCVGGWTEWDGGGGARDVLLRLLSVLTAVMMWENGTHGTLAVRSMRVNAL